MSLFGLLKKIVKPVITRPAIARKLSSYLLRGENLLDAWSNELLVYAYEGVHPKHALMNFSCFFIDHVTPNDDVLDIGCGRGIVAMAVADKARQITGIDFEKKNILFAQTHYSKPNLTFICGDALRDLPNREFDVIILSSVLEHIAERSAFLQQLRPLGKKLLIRVPLITRDWKPLLKQKWGIEHRLDKTHFMEYREEEFESEITAGGWRLEKSQTRFGELWAVAMRL